MADFKKGLMLLIWRFQQVNSMVIIIGLSMTLTLQIYPYIGWRFYFLISSELDWLIILVIFIIIFSGAVFVGILYDTIFKLWIQQQVVTIERNPFAKEKITAKTVLNKKYFWIPMLQKAGLESEAKLMNKWVEKNMEQDPILRRDVNRVIQWINEYKLKPADKRWLKDIESILNKEYSPKGEKLIIK
jgi:hypothetical protein